MCLENEQEAVRLTEDEIYYKVFSKYVKDNGELLTVHNRHSTVYFSFSADKKFDTRKGYQVFEAEPQAQRYCDALRRENLGKKFVVKPVLVRKGALKRKGIIKRGYIFSGTSAMRVSSLEILVGVH